MGGGSYVFNTLYIVYVLISMCMYVCIILLLLLVLCLPMTLFAMLSSSPLQLAIIILHFRSNNIPGLPLVFSPPLFPRL